MKNRTERTRHWYMGGILLLALVGLGLVGGSAAAKPGTDAPAGKAPATNGLGAMPTCMPGWTVFDSPSPGTETNWLRDVAVISADDVWAVGHQQDVGSPVRTLIMRWQGERWNVVPSPKTAGSSALRSIDGTSANDVWAVGHSGASVPHTALIMHWDGTRWSIVSLPPGIPGRVYGVIYAVEAIAPNDVWAVADLEYSAVTLHWDGSTWSEIPLPSSDNYLDLRAISAVSSDDVWAVGFQGNADGEGAAIVHWDGTQWSMVPSPSSWLRRHGLRLKGVTAVSTDDVLAVGYYKSPDPSYYNITPMALHWDGTGWSEAPTSQFPQQGYLMAAAATSTNNIWIAGFDNLNSTLFKHWDGHTLNHVPSVNPGDATFFEGIDAAAGEVWAVGYFSSAGYQTLVARYTHSCAGAP